MHSKNEKISEKGNGMAFFPQESTFVGIEEYFENKEQKRTVCILFQEILRHYGVNLVSCAIFGSYARKDARLNSDLDVFIVLSEFSFSSRNQVHRDFVENIENSCQVSLDQLRNIGIDMDISPIIFSKLQASKFNPLYYDMTDSVVFIHDSENFLRNTLSAVRDMMKKYGSKKVFVGGRWYWQAKSDLNFGESISYEI